MSNSYRLRSLTLPVVVFCILAGCSGGGAASNPTAQPTEEPRSADSPAAESTTERRVVIPPPGGTSTATQFRGYPVDRMVIADFGNIQREVLGEREVEAIVPWPIVLPSYLPQGYDRIGLVQVSLPMPNLPAAAAARTTRVLVGFRSSAQRASFSLIISGGHVGMDATEQLMVNGEGALFSVNPQGSQNLAWDLCGRTFMLSALEKDLSRDELIRIAESVPEQRQ